MDTTSCQVGYIVCDSSHHHNRGSKGKQTSKNRHAAVRIINGVCHDDKTKDDRH